MFGNNRIIASCMIGIYLEVFCNPLCVFAGNADTLQNANLQSSVLTNSNDTMSYKTKIDTAETIDTLRSVEQKPLPNNLDTVTDIGSAKNNNPDTMASQPPTRDNYYHGDIPEYQGAARGAALPSTSQPNKRKMMVDTIHTTAVDSMKSDTISKALAPPPPRDSLPYIPASKLSLNAKIAVAAGVVVITGAIVSYLLIKKHRNDEAAQNHIPDPPAPPGI